jgi:cytochrome c biogenesis protein CcmG/thiol:disulfide interchange protein DsbE
MVRGRQAREATPVRKLRSIGAGLAGSVLVGGAAALSCVVWIESRALVYLFFVVPSLVALGVGWWRGRAGGLPRWLDLAIVNVLCLALAVVLGASGGAWQILILPLLTAASSALGIWAAPGAAGVRVGRGWLGGAAALLVLANLALALGVHRFAESLIVHLDLDQPAPAYRLAMLGGGSVASQELLGRVVVLDFWTSWCLPCRREFPELEKVYERFRGRPQVAFFAVDGDRGDTPDNARRFFREAGYRLPVAYDTGSKVYESFSAPGFPTLVVIDRSGRLRFRHTGFLGSEDFEGHLTRVIEDLLR